MVSETRWSTIHTGAAAPIAARGPRGGGGSGGQPPERDRGETAIQVRFGFGRTSLGQVLVASTARGICAVKIGDQREALVADLKTEFPHADIRREDGAVDVALTRILEAIDAGGPTPKLPLDVRATAFQTRVWRALMTIPRGETRTYLDIAREIGAPRAVRAVAGACAANPVAIVIPCHRVVRTDGESGGYRWGEQRKRAILERERPE